MAISITKESAVAWGNRKVVFADIVGDTSYPTGGSTLTPAQLGMTRITYVDSATTTGGVTFVFDRTNNKMLTFTGGTQTTNATNQSSITQRVMFIGR